MYLLFGGWNYYERGGWEDFLGSYDTLEAAVTAGKESMKDGARDDSSWKWWQVVDFSAQKIVEEWTAAREYPEDRS